MKPPLLSFFSLLPFLCIMALCDHVLAIDITPPVVKEANSPAADSGDAAPALPANQNAAPLADTNSSAKDVSVTPTPALPANADSKTDAALSSRDLPEIHAKILLPKNWTLIPGKLLEGDVLLATREKISTENDPWTTGLSMTVDRNGAQDSGQKASEYALALAHEASEKAGDQATPIRESQAGPFHEIRFDFPVEGDPPLAVTEVLRANDATGTLVVILWQSSLQDAEKLRPLKESILAGLKLDPTQ